jgi:hypothetical protein
MKTTYTVRNIYGITGTSNHSTPELAIKARDSHKGVGWVVVNDNGIIIDLDQQGNVHVDDN